MMSDPDVLEIEVEDHDFVEEVQQVDVAKNRQVNIVETRRVYFVADVFPQDVDSDAEEQEEPAKRRRVVMETEEESGALASNQSLLSESSAIRTASPSTPTSAAILSLPAFVSRVKRYKQRIAIVHPGLKAPIGFPTRSNPDPSLKPMTIDFTPSDSEGEDEYPDPTQAQEEEEEDSYRQRPWLKKKKLPHPVQAFVEFQWQDRLGREFAENLLPKRIPTNMPFVTLAEANRLISRKGPFFVGVHQKLFPKVTQFKSGDRTDTEMVKDFLISVRAWRCLCFDTETNGELPFLLPPNRGQPGRVPVVFGNPEGQVLIFHDPRDVPQAIKDICADFGYVKFQSGIENDILLLKKCGFTFRGIVDVQTLLTLAKPASRYCGIEECSRYVWQTDPRSNEKLRIKWLDKKFMFHYVRQDMTEDCLAHSVQDVLTPFAVALKLAIEVTKLRGIDQASENIFPALNEAFELCMSKAPADIRNSKADCLDKTFPPNNWINDECPNYSLPFQFNSHHIVQRIRRARGDLVEVFSTGLSQSQIIERARKHLALLKTDKFPLGRMPPAAEQAFIDLRYHLMDHCEYCGSQDHKGNTCTILAVPCQYEHGPDVVHPPHSIICCPSLHAFCNLCRIRGHPREVHGRNWKSAGQLRRIFLESAPFGLYTSLPYLIRDKEFAPLIKSYHFKAGLGGKKRIYNFGDYWLYGGSEPIAKEEMDDGAEFRRLSFNNLRASPSTYTPLNTRVQRRLDLEATKGADRIGKRKRPSGAEQKRRKRAAEAARLLNDKKTD